MEFYSVQLRKKVTVPDSQVKYVMKGQGKMKRRFATAETTIKGQKIKLFRIVKMK